MSIKSKKIGPDLKTNSLSCITLKFAEFIPPQVKAILLLLLNKP